MRNGLGREWFGRVSLVVQQFRSIRVIMETLNGEWRVSPDEFAPIVTEYKWWKVTDYGYSGKWK